MKTALILIAALALGGCSRGLDQKIDGSSELAYKASLAKMRQVQPDDAKRLEEAIRVLAVSDVSIGFEGGILGAMRKLESRSAESLAEFVLPQVNGRTGHEVVALADTRRREQAGKQLAATDAEIEKLRKARAEKESAREFLARIQILEPRIAIVGAGAQRAGILDFKVANGSEEALSSLYLRAVVTGADGKVLLTDEFTYRASPAIGVAQTRDVRLPSSAPNKWNTPELARQSELTLQLQVENAATAAGSRLAASFTQKDTARLASLERDRPQLAAMAAAK